MRANNLKTRAAAIVIACTLSAIPAFAIQPSVHDVTPQLMTAGVTVEGLRAVEVGGIVVLRGRTGDRAAAEQAGTAAQSLGYSRVANLIQVFQAPDDARIERAVERELSVHRGLDGTRIAVDSTNGVVRLTGKVYSELQKDMAVNVVKTVDGVRSVEASLQR
ncbi:MAG TPA: BON domain-containing protein [Thermoanaerobaculia bacterium]|jgi:osmotically-inducible protein OsmY|nr:BON domain-containing protein [Thermoanaerobaculia bacterium]